MMTKYYFIKILLKILIMLLQSIYSVPINNMNFIVLNLSKTLPE